MNKCPHCGHEQDGFMVTTIDQTENGHDIEAALCESCGAVVDDMTSCPHEFVDWQGFCIECGHWVSSVVHI